MGTGPSKCVPKRRPQSRKTPPQAPLRSILKKAKSHPPPPPPRLEESSLPPPPLPSQNWKLPPSSESRSLPPAATLPMLNTPNSGPSTEFRLMSELAFLEYSFKRTLVFDGEGTLILGPKSAQWLAETEARLASWISASSLEGWGYVIHAHLVALRTILNAFKAYYFDSKPDYYVCYSLFQSSIINFCNAMQSFQSYRPDCRPLHSGHYHRMGVAGSVVTYRDELVHGVALQPQLGEIIKQTVLVYAWYGTYFWPKLTFEYEIGQDGKHIWWLTLKMNFPKVDIVEQKDWIKVSKPNLVDNLTKVGYPVPELT